MGPALASSNLGGAPATHAQRPVGGGDRLLSGHTFPLAAPHPLPTFPLRPVFVFSSGSGKGGSASLASLKPQAACFKPTCPSQASLLPLHSVNACFASELTRLRGACLHFRAESHPLEALVAPSNSTDTKRSSHIIRPLLTGLRLFQAPGRVIHFNWSFAQGPSTDRHSEPPARATDGNLFLSQNFRARALQKLHSPLNLRPAKLTKGRTKRTHNSG